MVSDPAALFDLSGRVGVVTGAGRGLGQVMALAMARAGADIAVLDIDKETANQTAEMVKAVGRRSLDFGTDVTSMEQIEAMARKVIEVWGKIDILVNNAGINIRHPILELEEPEWDDVIRVNLKGVFIGTKVVGREMVKRRYGKIINIASQSGLYAHRGEGMSPYHASKAGVIMFTKAAAGEWASFGVCVNCISPGFIVTDFNRHIWEKDTELAQRRIQVVPLGRTAQPHELEGAILFLASAASDYVTGHNLLVDGGYSIW